MDFSSNTGLTDVPVPACVIIDKLALLATYISSSLLEGASCTEITIITLFALRWALNFSILLCSGSKT